ncbi:MAG: APC family permease [Methanomicrobiales archaeon]|nr:APC family permease [Methanomicrobiales archaeon]
MKPRRELTLFDLTNIVIGSIVGADIYIASTITAGLIGPFALVIWIIAGVLAGCLALVFAYCSYYIPRAGGPFAYVTAAFDDFFGFLTGWSLWIAEMVALPVFAIAFVQYLHYLVPLDPYTSAGVKVLFIGLLTLTNIRGVKTAGRINDVLTIAKLSPLLLLVGAGFLFFIAHPGTLAQNYTPLAPLGLENFGTALVLIFWAYVGFEMATLPANEVINPRTTIPRAIILGISAVTLFYISTNFVVYGVLPWQQLSTTSAPLVLVGALILGSFGAVLMSLGALVSVSGSDESGILGTARLSYAMAIDGLFPRVFARLHSRFSTPWVALVIQGIIATVLSLYSGIRDLISFSVFNMGFAFFLTCCALIVLQKNREKHLPGQRWLPWVGLVICAYLLYSTSIFDKVVGTLIILAGIPLYVFFSPKVAISDMKKLFLSEEAIFVRNLQLRERFLANFISLLHRMWSNLYRMAHPGNKEK